MTQDSAPITVPPELVQQWWDGTHGAFYEFEAVVTQAARWGADQELEACCEWLRRSLPGYDKHYADCLRTARRPKPPSLKELALETFNKLEHLFDGYGYDGPTIRRALESLPD